MAVLGFEYGYSLTYPEALVMWEAQFGDFVNVAQPIIDQFITSAEGKWGMLSGLVLLLPHGFEGMGPEHSSARLERFLQLAAEDNLQIANPTTPAQMFHLLRRQVWRHWRKPLVVMTPKSLLAQPGLHLGLDDLAEGVFPDRCLPIPAEPEPAKVKRVLLCSGKVYYDLVEERERLERDDVAILRLEQPYPAAGQRPGGSLGRYPDEATLVWVQEEPANMGVWPYLRYRFGERLLGRQLHGRLPARGPQSGHRFGGQPQARTLSLAGPGLRPGGRPGSRSRPWNDDQERNEPMPIEVRVPDLGESINEVEVSGWLKQPGEAVALDEPLIELESDKATVEVPSPAAGVVVEIVAEVGAVLKIGDLLVRIEEGTGGSQAERVRAR